jgi:hypothetical protein
MTQRRIALVSVAVIVVVALLFVGSVLAQGRGRHAAAQAAQHAAAAPDCVGAGCPAGLNCTEEMKAQCAKLAAHTKGQPGAKTAAQSTPACSMAAKHTKTGPGEMSGCVAAHGSAGTGKGTCPFMQQTAKTGPTAGAKATGGAASACPLAPDCEKAKDGTCPHVKDCPLKTQSATKTAAKAVPGCPMQQADPGGLSAAKATSVQGGTCPMMQHASESGKK